jgi:hypothetical protein
MKGLFYQVALSAKEVDVSAITYFAPILAFLIVFVLMYALLNKTEIVGDSWFVQLFVSFVIASMFVAAASVRQYVLSIVPWFAVLIIALFFILMITGLIGGEAEKLAGKGLGIGFIVILMFVFLLAGIKVFAGLFGNYLPGPYFGIGGDEEVLFFLNWLYSPRVAGAVALIIVAAIVSWILVKFGGEKQK